MNNTPEQDNRSSPCDRLNDQVLTCCRERCTHPEGFFHLAQCARFHRHSEGQFLPLFVVLISRGHRPPDLRIDKGHRLRTYTETKERSHGSPASRGLLHVRGRDYAVERRKRQGATPALEQDSRCIRSRASAPLRRILIGDIHSTKQTGHERHDNHRVSFLPSPGTAFSGNLALSHGRNANLISEPTHCLHDPKQKSNAQPASLACRGSCSFALNQKATESPRLSLTR